MLRVLLLGVERMEAVALLLCCNEVADALRLYAGVEDIGRLDPPLGDTRTWEETVGNSRCIALDTIKHRGLVCFSFSLMIIGFSKKKCFLLGLFFFETV